MKKTAILAMILAFPLAAQVIGPVPVTVVPGPGPTTTVVVNTATPQAPPVTASPADAREEKLNTLLQQGSGGMLTVIVRSKDDDYLTSSSGGTIASVSAIFAVMIYSDYPDAESGLVVKDRQPEILVATPPGQNPKGRVFLVKCDPSARKKKRSVKMGQTGFASAGGFGAPDPDWTLPYSAELVRPNFWKLALKEKLDPGEYGIWYQGGNDLYGFTISK